MTPCYMAPLPHHAPHYMDNLDAIHGAGSFPAAAHTETTTAGFTPHAAGASPAHTGTAQPCLPVAQPPTAGGLPEHRWATRWPHDHHTTLVPHLPGYGLGPDGPDLGGSFPHPHAATFTMDHHYLVCTRLPSNYRLHTLPPHPPLPHYRDRHLFCYILPVRYPVPGATLTEAPGWRFHCPAAG